jgi:hypothetical protein
MGRLLRASVPIITTPFFFRKRGKYFIVRKPAFSEQELIFKPISRFGSDHAARGRMAVSRVHQDRTSSGDGA